MRTVLDRIAGRVFMLGPAPGRRVDVQDRQQHARRPRTSRPAPRRWRSRRRRVSISQRVCDVVNASSGASWIFADRVARALDRRLCRRAPRRACSTRMWRSRRRSPDRLDVDAPFTQIATQGVCRGDGRRVRRGRRCGVGAPRARRREATQRPVAAAVAAPAQDSILSRTRLRVDVDVLPDLR